MLAIDGQPRYDTRTGQRQGAEFPVIWVEVPDADPRTASIANQAVYAQGHAAGGATFGRLEGCFWGNGKIYLNATNGGDAHKGQVWQYAPDGDRGILTLLFESPGAAVLNNPDNICVSPRGGLVLCEDGDGVQHLRGLTQDGQVFDFARNAIPRYENREWCGSTFSPDGSTLFVNIQSPGVTFALWGPWDRGAL
jgi:secreted PhoX family phosphatase